MHYTIDENFKKLWKIKMTIEQTNTIHDWSEVVTKQPLKQVDLIAAYNDNDYQKALHIAEGIKQDMSDLITWTQSKL